jgi:hypothetical protein
MDIKFVDLLKMMIFHCIINTGACPQYPPCGALPGRESESPPEFSHFFSAVASRATSAWSIGQGFMGSMSQHNENIGQELMFETAAQPLKIPQIGDVERCAHYHPRPSRNKNACI